MAVDGELSEGDLMCAAARDAVLTARLVLRPGESVESFDAEKQMLLKRALADVLGLESVDMELIAMAEPEIWVDKVVVEVIGIPQTRGLPPIMLYTSPLLGESDDCG
eukprot:644115-Rhodomonas_salina.2